jgi:hypothetical protein
MLYLASNNSFDRSAASTILIVASTLPAAHGQLGRYAPALNSILLEFVFVIKVIIFCVYSQFRNTVRFHYHRYEQEN